MCVNVDYNKSQGLEPVFHQQRRVTDARTLECVKESAGFVRVQIESMLGRGLVKPAMASKVKKRTIITKHTVVE